MPATGFPAGTAAGGRPLEQDRGRSLWSVGVDAEPPGLFDLPDRADSTRPERLQRGRNRETWVRTASAEVTIVDAGALREALTEAEAHAVALDVVEIAEDAEPEDSEPTPTTEALDCPAWLIWPAQGLEELLEAGAFRLLEVNVEVAAESDDVGTVTWTVTVKLTDVDQLRRLAIQNFPDEPEAIKNSLAVAWQHAADPFRPVDSIPGITWRPGQVNVEHLRARATQIP